MVEASPESPFVESSMQANGVLGSIGLSRLRSLSGAKSCSLRGF
jgi:hypothetical protein